MQYLYFQLNLGILPKCEQYYRQQGYDFQLRNGQVVLVRRTQRHVRQRRQGQVGCLMAVTLTVSLLNQSDDPFCDWGSCSLQQSSISLDSGHALQIIPRQRTAGQPITWTGLGLVRVLGGAGLRFTVDNIPSSMDYQLVIRYEPEVRTAVRDILFLDLGLIMVHVLKVSC